MDGQEGGRVLREAVYLMPTKNLGGSATTRFLTYRLDGVVSGILELFNVVGGNAMLLKDLDGLVVRVHLFV